MNEWGEEDVPFSHLSKPNTLINQSLDGDWDIIY